MRFGPQMQVGVGSIAASATRRTRPTSRRRGGPGRCGRRRHRSTCGTQGGCRNQPLATSADPAAPHPAGFVEQPVAFGVALASTAALPFPCQRERFRSRPRLDSQSRDDAAIVTAPRVRYNDPRSPRSPINRRVLPIRHAVLSCRHRPVGVFILADRRIPRRPGRQLFRRADPDRAGQRAVYCRS